MRNSSFIVLLIPKVMVRPILKFKLMVAFLSIFYFATAQPGDKSYLKQLSPTSKNHKINFIPNSKFGPVVTLSNLPEALKNPSYYKSARFTNLNLNEFPDQIFVFLNLEEIDVSGNNLRIIPNKLNELKNLKELHLNNNRLNTLGAEITSCKKLEVLQIQDNPLVSISKELGNMLTMREITIGEIDRNCSVPLELWSLKNLKKIKITNAFLTEIPAAIADLKFLDELCLAHNLITEIPEGLYSLKSITYINLGYNKIKSISPSIKALENLDYLGIYYNPITLLPEEISNLKNLSFLSCWQSKLPQSEIVKARLKLPDAQVQDTETDIH